MTQRSMKGEARSNAFRDTPHLPLNPMCTRCAVNGLVVSCSLETVEGKDQVGVGWWVGARQGGSVPGRHSMITHNVSPLQVEIIHRLAGNLFHILYDSSSDLVSTCTNQDTWRVLDRMCWCWVR